MDRADARREDVTATVTATARDADSSWERFEALYRASRDDVYAYAATLQGQRGGAVAPGGDGGGGFTPAPALHDAGRLLAVTGGVVVIAAAALVPLAVVLALAWPAARVLRRRRRDQALDGV
jgi:hypothetical protein